MKLKQLFNNNTFLVNWCVCLVVFFLIFSVGVTTSIKKTYSTNYGDPPCLGMSYITEDGIICVGEENKLYGKYKWNDTLIWEDGVGTSGTIINISFTSNGSSYDGIKYQFTTIPAHTLFYRKGGEDVKSIMTHTKVGEVFELAEGAVTADLYMYFDSAQTPKNNEGELKYDWFMQNATPVNECRFNESADKFVWTNVEEIGYRLTKYPNESDCNNARYIKIIDSDGYVTINGGKGPHTFYFYNGYRFSVKSLFDAVSGSNLTRTGYNLTFNTKQDGTGNTYPVNNTNTLTQNLTLYAQWEAETYTITFEPNGGSGTKMPNQTFTYNKAANLSPNTYTRDGYVFSGWNTKADGSGTSYVNQRLSTFTSDTTLYAQWTELDKFTLSYNANTGDSVTNMPSAVTKYKGEVVAVTYNVPVRIGYDFQGWNTKADGTGNPYKSGSDIVMNSNIILYAQWELQELYVTFNKNGGTGNMSNQLFEYNVSQKLNANEFTKDGYTFNGWNTEPDNSGESYNDKESIQIVESITLYAIWEPIEYTVTFDSNGGNGTMSNQVFKHGVLQSLNANIFTRDGYVFSGWTENSSGTGKVYADRESISITKNMTLYAKWTQDIVKYTVTFNANGGSGTMSAQEFISGTPQKIKANTFTRNGFNFIGWNTNSNGTGTSYSDGEQTNITKNMILYAQWEKILENYTVTFNANGGSGTMSAQTFVEGVEQALNENKYVNDGYVFAGWSQNADGSGATYPDKYSMIVTKNMTLYAVWKETQVFSINNYIVDEAKKIIVVDIGTTKDVFENNIKLSSGYKVSTLIKTIAGKETLYTGSVVKILKSDGSTYAEYTVAVLSDLDGTGTISTMDFVYVYNSFDGSKTLSDLLKLAADVNADGLIDTNDFVAIYNSFEKVN